MKHSCRLDFKLEQTGIAIHVYCAFNPSDTLNNVNTAGHCVIEVLACYWPLEQEEFSHIIVSSSK